MKIENVTAFTVVFLGIVKVYLSFKFFIVFSSPPIVQGNWWPKQRMWKVLLI